MVSNRAKSKRQSDTKSRRSQPDPVFFVDRNLGRKVFPNHLKQADIRVEIHDEHFEQDESDEVWLRTAGQQGWVVLTNDKAIRYRSVETAELMGANVRMFVLSGNLKAVDSANVFIEAFPRVKNFLIRHKAPFIARIYKDGKIKMRRSYTQLGRPKN